MSKSALAEGEEEVREETERCRSQRWIDDEERVVALIPQ